MESQSKIHETTQKPVAESGLGTDPVVSSDEQAPVRVLMDIKPKTRILEAPLKMHISSQGGDREINFDPILNYQQQKPLPPSSVTQAAPASSPSEPANAMNADLVVSSDEAPVRVVKDVKPIKSVPLTFTVPMEMYNSSKGEGQEINFDPVLNYQQQKPLPPSSVTQAAPASSPSEPANAMNGDFYRCLRSGKIDSLKRMLEDEEGSFLDQVTPQKNTALHIVARRGLDQLIELILTRRPGLLTLQNANGDTALHLAAEAGHWASVVGIVEFVKDANRACLCETKNNDGENALHVAVRHRRIRVAISLIEAHPKASYCLNGRRESPLFVAAELGELQVVKDMISKCADGTDVQSSLEEGKSIVQAAISSGNSGVLEAILSEHKSLFSSNGGSVNPLSFASLKGNIHMVRYILTEFPDCAYKLDQDHAFPIHTAAGKGHKMVLKEFLKLYPDSRELLTLGGLNILHMAALNGKDDVVSYILSKPDFDELINAKDNQGNTPLHHAVAAKFPKVVDALTWDKRVRLDLVNNEGQTAMDVAMSIENPVPSLKEQLTWLALRYAGAPRRKFQQAKRSNESEQAMVDTYKDRVNTLSVVATLVITMTFAGGFTMPGGNSGSDPDLGMAVFLKRRIFQLFVISNSIALYTSVLDVIVLIFAMLGDVKLLQVSLKVAVPLLATSLATMSIGFMSAAYLAVSGLRWLGIVIWVLGSVFLALVLTLFFLLFPPLSAKNQFTRYIAYLPFRAMLYICERK